MSQQGSPSAAQKEREKFVTAFNSTMLKIWHDQIIKLNVIDTGTLLNSLSAIRFRADGKFLDIELGQAFRTYGIFVNYGTGSNTWRGNPGDIGRDNLRKKKPWFDHKYFASVRNLQEFLAENTGKEGAMVIANALNMDKLRQMVTL